MKKLLLLFAVVAFVTAEHHHHDEDNDEVDDGVQDRHRGIPFTFLDNNESSSSHCKMFQPVLMASIILEK